MIDKLQTNDSLKEAVKKLALASAAALAVYFIFEAIRITIETKLPNAAYLEIEAAKKELNKTKAQLAEISTAWCTVELGIGAKATWNADNQLVCKSLVLESKK